MNLKIIGHNLDPLAAVLAYMAEAKLTDGDQLPPERELAAELGISRRALRQVLAQLELEGQIWRGKRVGTVVGRRPPATAVSVDRCLRQSSPDGLMEARLAIEPGVAGLAATRATMVDLAKIENCVRRSAEVGTDEEWVRWDSAFHSAIAEATGNESLEALIVGFNRARSEDPWRALRVTRTSSDRQKQSVCEHRAILDALRRRQPEEAADAMRRHLSGVRNTLFGGS